MAASSILLEREFGATNSILESHSYCLFKVIYMTRFMIRVELHNARLAAQYERLHALLAAQGIVNEIVADNGQRYQLPPAEYHYSGNATQD